MDKILVVDDNEQNCEILEDVLSAWGYKVQKAFHGMEAYNFACKYKPDIILLDVMLPGMNGFEVCKKLKNNTHTQEIPIIMLTVLDEVEDRIRGYNVGANVFLSKPINYQELRNRIDALIYYKNTVAKMEHASRLVESFLAVIKAHDVNQYYRACRVKDYCEKVAKVLSLSDKKKERLLIGAYLHDIGKIVTDDPRKHVEVGEEIIAPLKMGDWLRVYVRNHHEKMNGKGFPDELKEQQISLELQILITINRFVEIWELEKDTGLAIVTLENESKNGCWSIAVVEALKQVLEDEKFLEDLYDCSNC